MPLVSKLRSKGVKVPQQPKEPVWQGPEKDGVTQSLLWRFLNCRERFRLLVVKGLKTADQFNQRLEFGNMWHLCEEAHADNLSYDEPLRKYTQTLCQRYKFQQEQVNHWYEVCRVTFPIYVDYWAKHRDVKHREPIFQEEKFAVPYKLPSGRTVTLRGKFDSVDVIGTGKGRAIYLQENKTKGDINEQQIKSQLTFDLQTMQYLIALRGTGGLPKIPIAGVRYNVIRRPLSGGKNTIRQHQPSKSNPDGESKEAFYNRLAGLIKAEPEFYFMRWKVEVSKDDYARFEQRCFIPILEQLCDWWEWVIAVPNEPWRIHADTGAPGPHWQHPYGGYNVLNEGGATDLDEHLMNGSEMGLQRVDNLFPELT